MALDADVNEFLFLLEFLARLEHLNTERIIEELEAERDRLESAITALQGRNGRRGRKPGRGRKPMSAEARKRISEAQKKRWAAQKRAAKG